MPSAWPPPALATHPGISFPPMTKRTRDSSFPESYWMRCRVSKCPIRHPVRNAGVSCTPSASGSSKSAELIPPPLFHNYDRSLPEGRLLSGGIEHRHLAIVRAGRELIESKIEAQGHGLQTIAHRIANGARLSFENLGLSAIKRDERHQWLRGGCGRLISLQIDVQLPAFAEDARHAWNQFLTFLHERVGCLGLLLTLDGIVDGFLQIHALAA